MIRPRSPRLMAPALMLAMLIVLGDQLGKWAVMRLLFARGAPVTVLPVFDLTFVQNKGVSFGLLSGQDARWLLAAFTVAMIALLLVWLNRAADRLTAAALGLILGGAVGNLIDRIRLGAVTDFLDVHWGEHHWPAFNVADSAICIGVGLLLLESLQKKE